MSQTHNPIESLKRLYRGHKRFLSRIQSHSQKLSNFCFNSSQQMQTPFATILSCSDSRVAPEVIFDQLLGDLFIVRTAGNHINMHSLASIEYSVTQLGVPLVYILGHTKCGAITAACHSLYSGETSNSDAISALLEDLKKGLPDLTRGSSLDEHISKSVNANVQYTCDEILKQSPILRSYLEEGRIQLRAGVYDLSNGHIHEVSIKCPSEYQMEVAQ